MEHVSIGWATNEHGDEELVIVAANEPGRWVQLARTKREAEQVIAAIREYAEQLP